MSQKIWLPTKAAAGELDLSPRYLRDLYRSGMFKMGVHVRDVSPPRSKRSTLQFHVERCSQLLATPPEKRKSYS